MRNALYYIYGRVVSGHVQLGVVAVQSETPVGPVSRRVLRAKNRKTKDLAHTGSVLDGYVCVNDKMCYI